ncbi:hypothetical protein [Soonwooa sp.]|uniref:hypothetical protein n=1 Tax=Soonwooa sp. TaxID=1938592 RepID=UPI0028AF097F|nr:hypothetical protein [Soonwooa sp.]
MNNALKLIIVAFVVASCSGNTENVSVPNDFNAETIISQQNNLQKILTKEMVAAVAGVPVDKIGEHIENNINQQGQYTILYSWANGNKKKVAGGKHEIDDYNSFSIGFIKKMTLAEFEQYYGTNEGLQMQVNNMAKQEHFNKETGTVESKYIADYAGRRKTEKLENVATMSFWETPMNALHVLAKDAAFTITANFGDDEALAKKKASELVNAILNP